MILFSHRKTLLVHGRPNIRFLAHFEGQVLILTKELHRFEFLLVEEARREW